MTLASIPPREPWKQFPGRHLLNRQPLGYKTRTSTRRYTPSPRELDARGQGYKYTIVSREGRLLVVVVIIIIVIIIVVVVIIIHVHALRVLLRVP